MHSLDLLIQHLSRLPGIGMKSASRLAYHLIQSDSAYNSQLAELIATIQDTIITCSVCNSYSETDPCDVCSDEGRDRSLLCVVEHPQDVFTISGSGAYTGLFHVLGGALSPLNGVGPQDLDFRNLIERIKTGSFKEVIIATNPTEEGDTTAMYLRHLLKGHDIRITRIASGLPIGGDLEYADKITLSRALRSRISFNE